MKTLTIDSDELAFGTDEKQRLKVEFAEDEHIEDSIFWVYVGSTKTFEKHDEEFLQLTMNEAETLRDFLSSCLSPTTRRTSKKPDFGGLQPVARNPEMETRH